MGIVLPRTVAGSPAIPPRIPAGSNSIRASIARTASAPVIDVGSSHHIDVGSNRSRPTLPIDVGVMSY